MRGRVIFYTLYPKSPLKFKRNAEIWKNVLCFMPNFGVKIPYSRFKILLYTVYPRTLADQDKLSKKQPSSVIQRHGSVIFFNLPIDGSDSMHCAKNEDLPPDLPNLEAFYET